MSSSLLRLSLLFILVQAMVVACATQQKPLSMPDYPAIPFVYYLQHADYDALSALDAAMLIVDPQYSGLTTEQIVSLKQQGKTLIAYLSIGEAESYRDYWQPDWRVGHPDWILMENPRWNENFRVDYRHPDWQAIVISRVQEIQVLGYDGLLLDVVEAFETLREKREVTASEAKKAMVNLVAQLRQTMGPDVQLIPNGGVELLQFADYRAVIDGQMKEDTFFNEKGPMNAEWTPYDLAYLAQASADDIYILAVDYPATGDEGAALQASRDAGFIPYIAPRDLGSVPAANHTYFTATPFDYTAWPLMRKR